MTRTSGKRNGNCGRIDYGFGLGGSVCSAIVAGPPQTFRVGRLSTIMACRPDYVDTDECALDYFELSSKQAGRLTGFGSEPLLVITRDPNKRDGMSPRVVAQSPIGEREQEESKSLSPLSWRVIARNSGHMVPLDRPDLIFTEMSYLIGYLRGGSAPPFGTTAIK